MFGLVNYILPLLAIYSDSLTANYFLCSRTSLTPMAPLAPFMIPEEEEEMIEPEVDFREKFSVLPLLTNCWLPNLLLILLISGVSVVL